MNNLTNTKIGNFDLIYYQCSSDKLGRTREGYHTIRKIDFEIYSLSQKIITMQAWNRTMNRESIFVWRMN